MVDGTVAVETLIPYIDWSPFFRSWDLHGKYPDILSDSVVGVEATKLLEDAKSTLAEGVERGWFEPKYVYGLFKANSIGDDIEIYDETGQQVLHRSIGLRQQIEKTPGQFNLCLSDYIAPKEQGIKDNIGCFAVTAGDVTEVCKAFEQSNDDYTSIMVKAIADRLAEALAEWLHEQVRISHWGYDKTPLKTRT